MKIRASIKMNGGVGVSIQSSEKAELAMQLSGEFWMIAMTGLFKTVYQERAIEFMRPHIRQNGMEVGYYVDEMTGGESSISKLALNIVIGRKHTRIPTKVEVVEGGVIATMDGCWAMSTDIQSCYCRLHEIHLKGNCEAIDSDYDARLSEIPTPGSQCRFVIRKKDVPLDEWFDYGQTIQIVPDVEIPREEQETNRLNVLSDYWVVTVNGFVDAVGSQRATEILRPCMAKSGIAWGLKMAEMFGIKPGEKGVAQLVNVLSEIMDLKGDVLVSSGRVDKAVGTCPFVKSSKEVCSLFDSFVEGFCTSLDSGIKFKPHKIECPNLPACYWIIKT